MSTGEADSIGRKARMIHRAWHSGVVKNGGWGYAFDPGCAARR
jgi:hypothetical protein